MPVAFDNSAFKVTNSSSVTIALTVASGAMLIVAVATKGVVGKSISAVFANGTQMTQFARIETPNTNAIVNTLYVLTASPSGTVSISANVVGGVAIQTALCAASYTGGKDVAPFTVATKATTSTALNNISVSSSLNDMVLIFATAVDVITAGDVNATGRVIDTSNFGVYFGDVAGANTSYSFSVSTSVATSYSVAMIALNINFSSSTAVARRLRMMLDIGF